MKKVANPDCDVGVIVGRFQIHELHSAHIDLINYVCGNHEKVIIFLGLSPLLVSRNNPLDFESRKQMILDKFPNVIVLYIKDMNSDQKWSAELDSRIKDVTTPNQSVVLYGSRDSFISHYSGKYQTQELVQETFISGSAVRNKISKTVKNSSDYRAGIIWAAYNQYPKCLTTVDVAIFNENYTKILLGRKEHESKYRFIGGFSDPKSESFEIDARREVMEETGLEVTDLDYVCSMKVSDWRYRQEVDCIKTLFFSCKVMFGSPKPDDDIAEVRWFDYQDFDINLLVDEHKKLFSKLMLTTQPHNKGMQQYEE